MSSTAVELSPITSVAIAPETESASRYTAARVAGFPPDPDLNLHRYPGRVIEHLTFTNVYLGGAASWSPADVAAIDFALPQAMSDLHLNNVLAQYYPDGKPTTEFKPSRILEGPLPPRIYRDTIEHLVAAVDLSGCDLETTALCFFLPRGAVLVDGTSDEHGSPPDSRHGLGGYHGSIHATAGTVYYTVGAYSEGANGIGFFREGWKNTCAVFYHELCELRTDPDVEDAIRAGNSARATDFLGWYSPRGGEIGDIPLEAAGSNLGSILKEVALTDGGGTVPVQLMWSNAVSGPEGPIARKHAH
jgi:hypothetical protein